MTKLTRFAICSMAALGLAACPKKDPDKADKDKAAAKVEDKKPDEPKPEAKPEAKADDGDLPAECKDYRAAIEKAASCDKLGAQRDQLKQAFDTASAAWAKLDAAGKKALADGCKTSAQAVTQATSAACP